MRRREELRQALEEEAPPQPAAAAPKLEEVEHAAKKRGRSPEAPQEQPQGKLAAC